MPSGPPGAAPTRPRTGLAWAVIAAVFLLVQGVHFLRPPEGAGTGDFSLKVMRFQVEATYGARELAGTSVPGFSVLEQTGVLERGTPAQRQRFSVVAGDQRGPAGAREVLDRIEALLAARGRRLEGDDARMQGILLRLYPVEGKAADPPVLSEDDRSFLRKELGWFGDLALAPPSDPPSPARRAILAEARDLAIRQYALVGLGIAALGAGLVGGIVFLVLLAKRGVALRLGTSGAPGGIYAETFAAWFLLFLALEWGLAWLFARLLPGAGILFPASLGSLLSLAALGWPVLRGVPFDRVRGDLGLFLSPTPVRDLLAGIACWFTALPVMAAGMLATFLLMALRGGSGGDPDSLDPVPFPSHPAFEGLGPGSDWIGILLAASVVAPVVEETFFRGALYRHLREATGGAGRPGSVLLSVAASGLLFAAIHPQGWVAVPALGAVSFGLCHAREWRGSLLAPVAAHALNNAVVTLAAFTALGS